METSITLKDAANAILAEEYRKKKAKRAKWRFDEDEKYYESGRWVCEDSPTGAHHWWKLKGEVWRCCWCKSYHFFPITYSDCIYKYPRQAKYRRVFSEKEVREAMEGLGGSR